MKKKPEKKPEFTDRELRFNAKVSRQSYHIVKGGKLLASAPTLDAALRTAESMGPGVTVISPANKRATNGKKAGK